MQNCVARISLKTQNRTKVGHMKTISLILFFAIVITDEAMAQATTCMSFDLYSETRDSRRVSELTLMSDSFAFLESSRASQCMASNSFQCVDYNMKHDSISFTTSQTASNELHSLIEQRKINKYCSMKLAMAKEYEEKLKIPEDERLNEQIFPYICTLATMLEDITRLFDNRDGKEREIAETENQVANLNAEIKKKEETIKIHEEKINEISNKIGTPGTIDESGEITKEGTGLLGDLNTKQSQQVKAEKELTKCKKQNAEAAQAHQESGSSEEFTPPCDVQEKEKALVQSKVELRLVAIELIEAMVELTGAETASIISMLKGTIYGQITTGNNAQSINFQINGENFQLANIGQAVSSNFGLSLDQASSFDPETQKEKAKENPAIQFLVDLVARLGKEIEEVPPYNIDNVNYRYGVGCTKESVAAGGCKQESSSDYFVDPEYGINYKTDFDTQTTEILNGMLELTGNDIADTSNLGAIAYAASLQAQQGRKDKIGTEESPEKGTIWASIKKDQDEISRLESGEESLEKVELAIAEVNAQIKDRLCILNSMLNVYRKTFKGLSLKEHYPSKKIQAEDLKSFSETLIGATKYLQTYVYNFNTDNLQKYSRTGYLGSYEGPLPREIAAEFVCVLRTDDVLGCQEKYNLLAQKSKAENGSCLYTGVMAGPAPPIGYPESCKKSEVGKQKNFEWYSFTCTCN